MRQISTWASQHVRSARLLIVFIKTTLFLLAAHTGLLLTNNEITLSADVVNAAVLCTVLFALALYPNRINKHIKRKFSYARQKLCDFLLPVCSFLVIACAVNNAGTSSYFPVSFASSIVTDPTAMQILASGKTKADLTKKEKRILHHEFKKQLKNYAAAKMKNDQQKADYAWKIVLAVIALIGLASVLAALSCSLSCSGYEGAAAAIGILGLAGLIWAFVAFVNHVKRPKKPKSE